MRQQIEAASAESKDEQRAQGTAQKAPKRKRGRPAAEAIEKWKKWKSTWKQKTQPMYVLNTEVKQSKQKGAGMGLFMLEKAKKGDQVAIYAGELITQEEVSKRN